MTDLYAVLGVQPSATADEISRAYRRQLRTLHPDVGGEANPDREERLRQVLAAYATLRDARLRADYDHQRARSGVHGGDQRSVPVHRTATSTPVAVSRDRGEPPPLWAGPVRWHRR